MNVLVLAPAVFLIAAAMPSHPNTPPVNMPGEVRGWKWDGNVAAYDANTIFDYIDGIGEVYRAYNMQMVWAFRYHKSDAPSLTVDIFDMGSPEDAYGIFSFEREGSHVGIGQQSEYAAGMLRFWKHRYFVCITAEQESEEVRQVVIELGKAIDNEIPHAGEPPSLLRALPPKGLLPVRLLFFRHHMILNRHFFVADRDILCLGPKVEGVLGVYQIGKNRLRLAVVRYPSEDESAKAWDTFSKSYLREGRAQGVVRTENKKWTAARRQGRTLVIVFDATTRQQALDMLKSVRVD